MNERPKHLHKKRAANNQRLLRSTIEHEVERLIALLDGMDGDADAEPNLGAPERHPGPSWGHETKGQKRNHSQEKWAQGADDDREDDGDDLEPSLGDAGHSTYSGKEYDLELDLADSEHSLGWTNYVDQEKAPLTAPGTWGVNDEGEPELGWTGNGRGCLPDEPADDREGDDEREFDPADAGVADQDALSDLENECGQLSLSQQGFVFDGSGIEIAEKLVEGLPTFYDRETFKPLLVAGLDPNRSEIERMRRHPSDYWSGTRFRP